MSIAFTLMCALVRKRSCPRMPRKQSLLYVECLQNWLITARELVLDVGG